MPQINNPYARNPRYQAMLLDTPISCPSCKDELIKFKGMPKCLTCISNDSLEAERTTTVTVINKDTNFEGIDWEQLEKSTNGDSVKAIRRKVQSKDFNILIYGEAKGVGKTTTAMVTKHYAELRGQYVIYTSMYDMQNKLKSDNVDTHDMSDKMKACDLLIVDEIGRGVADSNYYGDKKFYVNFWYEIIDKRVNMKKPTILIGNVSGMSRGDNKGGHYCDDYFDRDRLLYFDSYEYVGRTHRGRK